MTLQKTMVDLNRDNRLITVSPAIVSVKRLNAEVPEYVQIGPTIGGVKVEFTSRREYFSDDGLTGIIGGLVYGEDVTVRFTLSEAGIYNMATAMNYNDDSHIDIIQPVEGPPSDGQVAFQAGGRRDLEEYEIKVQARLVSGKKIREYLFFKAVPAADFMIRYSDGVRTVVDCTFHLLMDQSKPDAQKYFLITDYFDSDYGQIDPPKY